MISIGNCDKETKKVIDKKIEDAINKYCAQYSYNNIIIEPALVKAIIKKESDFCPYSNKIETHLKKAKWYLDLLTEEEKQNDSCFMSAGLMQEMYGLAKSDGFCGSIEDLNKIDTSLAWGICRLRKIIKWEWQLDRVISAWNQGIITKKKDGTKVYLYQSKYTDANRNGIKDWWEDWKNESYVIKVYYYYKQFGGISKLRKYQEAGNG